MLTVASGFIFASALPSKACKCLLTSLFTSSYATRQSIFHTAASMVFLKHKSDHIPPCLKFFSDFLTQQGGKAKLLFSDDKFRHDLDPAPFLLTQTQQGQSNLFYMCLPSPEMFSQTTGFLSEFKSLFKHHL